MVFSGITFLYYFLPLFFVIYFIVPERLRNGILLAFSLLFYAWGEPCYVYLMCILIFVGYAGGILIERYRDEPKGKIFLAFTLVIIVAALGFFKYADFLLVNLSRFTGIKITLLKVALPIGISFYSFQLISYVVDVYKDRIKAQKNMIIFFSYVSMFPQLIAGPIVRYKDIEKELQKRQITLAKIRQGITRFVIGLGKKTIFANELYGLMDIIEKAEDKSLLLVWVYAATVCLYVYYDFSGYSDMAIGIGRILGFTFPENFNYPFISGSITEFWRRWHITLGAWFRDYVYFPMGGSRVSTPKLLVNLLTVWLLTGLWHGAAWQFVVWGVFFGILLILEKTVLLKYLNKTHILKHIYVLFVLALSFVMFNAHSVGDGLSYIGKMLGNVNHITDSFTNYYLKSYLGLLLVAAAGSAPVKNIYIAYRKKNNNSATQIAELIFVLLVMTISTACIVNTSFNPFMYFRF